MWKVFTHFQHTFSNVSSFYNFFDYIEILTIQKRKRTRKKPWSELFKIIWFSAGSLLLFVIIFNDSHYFFGQHCCENLTRDLELIFIFYRLDRQFRAQCDVNGCSLNIKSKMTLEFRFLRTNSEHHKFFNAPFNFRIKKNFPAPPALMIDAMQLFNNFMLSKRVFQFYSSRVL